MRAYGTAPKALLRFERVSTLQHTISTLKLLNIRTVIVVAGYEAASVCSEVHRLAAGELRVVTVMNDQYAETDTAVSWYLAQEHILGDAIVIPADTMLSVHRWRELIAVTQETNIAVVSASSSAIPADVRVSIRDGQVSGIGKQIEGRDTGVEAVCIYRISSELRATLMTAFRSLPAAERGGRYGFELLIHHVVTRAAVRVLWCEPEEWCELDSPRDVPRVIQFARRFGCQ